jgi:hypothetical protein
MSRIIKAASGRRLRAGMSVEFWKGREPIVTHDGGVLWQARQLLRLWKSIEML